MFVLILLAILGVELDMGTGYWFIYAAAVIAKILDLLMGVW